MIRFCSLPNKERERERNSIPRDKKISLKDTPGEISHRRHTQSALLFVRLGSVVLPKKKDNKNKNKNFIVRIA